MCQPIPSACLLHQPFLILNDPHPCLQISKGSGSVFGVHPGPTRGKLIDLAVGASWAKLVWCFIFLSIAALGTVAQTLVSIYSIKMEGRGLLQAAMVLVFVWGVIATGVALLAALYGLLCMGEWPLPVLVLGAVLRHLFWRRVPRQP